MSLLEYYSIAGEGHQNPATSAPGSALVTHFYVKDHLGSTRMTIDGKNASFTPEEITMYDSYGVMDNSFMAAPSATTREKFTTKEFDQDGDVNGAVGIAMYYFGARYYDPDVGVWGSADPVEQDWNTYGYCGGDPINMVDPNGMSWKGFWQFLGLSSADMLSGGLLSGSTLTTAAFASTTAIGAAGIGIGAAAFALGAAATVGTALIDPGVYMLSGSINNTFHNLEGIKDGKPITKTITSWFGGLASGLADWGNMVTFGVLHDIAAQQSSAALGYSHNYAFDKPWDDAEAYDVSNQVLSDIYGYGLQGTWAKITGDLVYTGHVLGEEPMQVYGNKYDETRNRFYNMKMKMTGGQISGNGITMDYSKLSEGHNNKTDALAHRIGGRVLGSKVYYYGFEVWGENYVHWDKADYYTDGNKGEPNPKGYWR